MLGDGLSLFPAGVGHDVEDSAEQGGHAVAHILDVGSIGGTAQVVFKHTGQNEGHDNGDDAINTDPIEFIEESGVFTIVNLAEYVIGLELAANAQRHEHSANGHCKTFSDEVKEVEPAVNEHHVVVTAGETENVGGGDTVGAKAADGDQNGFNHDCDGDPENGLFAVCGLALGNCLVHEVGRNDLHQGDGGGDSGQQDQQVEDNAEQGAGGAHVGENILQSDEQELRAIQNQLIGSEAACKAVGNGGGDNGETGHQSDDSISHNDNNGVLDQILFLVKVRAVGDHSAHCKGQGEEHLTTGSAEDADEVGCFLDKAARHSVAGNEHELETLNSVGQGQGADDDDDEHHEQGGHTDLVELLNAALNATLDDEHADYHEQESEHDAAEGVGEHCAEGGTAGDGAAEDAAQAKAQLGKVQGHVLNAVAAKDRVEAHDKEGGKHCQPAYPCKFLGSLFVRRDGVGAGLTTKGQLTDHDYHAHEDCQQQVNYQEGKAAAATHFVREAPDVAEANCRTDCGKQEA